MKDRIAKIIDRETDGNKSEFASACGWSPQYLNNILAGKSLGLKPIQTIINTYPEINAQWLLTGEGQMVTNEETILLVSNVLARAVARMTKIGDMTDEQKYKYICAIRDLNKVI